MQNPMEIADIQSPMQRTPQSSQKNLIHLVHKVEHAGATSAITTAGQVMLATIPLALLAAPRDLVQVQWGSKGKTMQFALVIHGDAPGSMGIHSVCIVKN